MSSMISKLSKNIGAITSVNDKKLTQTNIFQNLIKKIGAKDKVKQFNLESDKKVCR